MADVGVRLPFALLGSMQPRSVVQRAKKAFGKRELFMRIASRQAHHRRALLKRNARCKPHGKSLLVGSLKYQDMYGAGAETAKARPATIPFDIRGPGGGSFPAIRRSVACAPYSP